MRSRWIIAAACLGLLLIGVLRSPALAQQTQPKQKPRAAPPDAAAEEKALTQARGVYGAEYDNAKTPQQKSALAAKLLAAAKRARKGSADLYVLSKLARDAAVQAGNPALALGAVDLMAEQFEIDGLKMKTELLPKLAKAARQPAEEKALALACITAAEQAVARDDYSAAEKMLDLASAAARDLKDQALLRQLAARREVVQELGRVYAVVAQAKSVLDQKSKDPSASLAVGSFLCLWKADWEKGLPMLASSSDPTLRQLAEKELAVGESAQARLALADAWWDLALRSDGTARKQVQVHAASWYKQALAGLPDGPAKSKAQKRVTDVEGFAGSLAVPTKSPTHPGTPAGTIPGMVAGPPPEPLGTSEAGRRKRLMRKGRYESMLGMYSSAKKPTPLVNLNVPNGSNMLTDAITAPLRGRFDLGQLSYAGVARFEIPKDGNYEFDQHCEKVFVNGRDMGFGGSKGSVFLARGAYQIRVQESGTRLKTATLSIKNKQSGEPVALFNYGADIDQFLRQTIGPWKVVEVSAWEPTEVPSGR